MDASFQQTIQIRALETKLSKVADTGSCSSNNPASNSTRSTANSKNSNSRNSGKSSYKGKGKRETPSWMTQWPGRDFVENNQPKVKDGKTYYWCKNHKKFCMHETSECRLANPSSSQGRNPSSSSDSSGTNQCASSNPSPSLRFSTATMMNE